MAGGVTDLRVARSVADDSGGSALEDVQEVARCKQSLHWIVKNAVSLLVLGIVFGWAHSAFAADPSSTEELLRLARGSNPQLGAALRIAFSDKDLLAGTAWRSRGSTFLFAVRSSARPELQIDDTPQPPMSLLSGTDLYYEIEEIGPAQRLHRVQYRIGEKVFGGTTDLPVFGPLASLAPGTPTGILRGPFTCTSKIYDGMKSRYWVYVPAQYDPKRSIALMVFQDGHNYIERESANPALNVLDNLMVMRSIPPLLSVFIDPGEIAETPVTPTLIQVKSYSTKWQRPLDDAMRSTLYDTVSDRYGRFLKDELLADVEKEYNVRKDAFSRGITGASSGGICAFNAAWQMPDQFSRVLSWIGSFVSLQWQEDPKVPSGGQDYPDKVLREPKRNIRVWLQDGSHDMEGSIYERRYGSWPLGNLRMANALKMADYDFHLSFGTGTHNNAQGAMELGDSLRWLWRDYDPSRTEQNYTMDPAERVKPPFRAGVTNRETD